MEEGKGQAAVSRKQFARLLGVSVDSVIRGIARGDIKSIRFGRRVLIPRSELERLLQGAK